MKPYLLLPALKIEDLVLGSDGKVWLEGWLETISSQIEDGDLAASECVQAIMAEHVLYKEFKHDWMAICNELLTDAEGLPLAYSEKCGTRLFQFNFWKQTTMQAVHSRWWIEQVFEVKESERLVGIIESFIQPSGWIYNPAVSPTGERTRMKAELCMSALMALEILASQGCHEKPYIANIRAALVSLPPTGFISPEYFRMRGLDMLGDLGNRPTRLRETLEACEGGEGYCDFNVAEKVDDYMGTAKRSSRDKPIHSALISLLALRLSEYVGEDIHSFVLRRTMKFGEYLSLRPLDIPAFRIRDIDIPFGTDLSVFEVLSATYLSSLFVYNSSAGSL